MSGTANHQIFAADTLNVQHGTSLKSQMQLLHQRKTDQLTALARLGQALLSQQTDLQLKLDACDDKVAVSSGKTTDQYDRLLLDLQNDLVSWQAQNQVRTSVLVREFSTHLIPLRLAFYGHSRYSTAFRLLRQRHQISIKTARHQTMRRVLLPQTSYFQTLRTRLPTSPTIRSIQGHVGYVIPKDPPRPIYNWRTI